MEIETTWLIKLLFLLLVLLFFYVVLLYSFAFVLTFLYFHLRILDLHPASSFRSIFIKILSFIVSCNYSLAWDSRFVMVPLLSLNSSMYNFGLSELWLLWETMGWISWDMCHRITLVSGSSFAFFESLNWSQKVHARLIFRLWCWFFLRDRILHLTLVQF